MWSKTFMAILTVNILEIRNVTFWDLTLLQVVLCSSTYVCVCVCVCVCVHAHVCVSHSVVSNCLWPHGLQPTRLLCPWNSPGNNSEVGSHSFLQGIFPTQGLNPHLNALQADYLLSEPPGKSLKYTKQINPSVMWLNLSHWSVSTLILWWHFQFLPSLLFNLMFPVLTHMS